jgi:hypothetical protein
MPSAVTPVVVTPELAAAALASELSPGPALEALGIAFPAAGEDKDAAVLEAWLGAIAVPLGMPDDECAQWLAAVAVLVSADGGSVTVGEVRDAVFGAVDDKNSDERADQWLDEWVLFGAVVPVDGDSVRITPLGRLLADSVTAMLAPAPAEGAASVVERFATVPVRSRVIRMRRVSPKSSRACGPERPGLARERHLRQVGRGDLL